MDTNTVIAIVVPIIVVVLGALMGYWFQKSRERKEKLYERKERYYSSLLIALRGFYV